MPELPEVEVVRQGLERWIDGRVVASVEVAHPRAVRRHAPGPADFAARITGRRIGTACRRGKYLWLPLLADPAEQAGTDGAPAHDAAEALVGHLGMSGQLLVGAPDRPWQKHVRVRLTFTDGGPDLRFVDQRTFGGLLVADLMPPEQPAAPAVPEIIAHIAPDPLDPVFDPDVLAAAVRRRDSELKRALLDQSLISGVGNIYADEALWLARLHGARSTRTLRRAELDRVIAAVREVMTAALAVGGTSFDSLYVNVNGESGYFERSLEAYGREDEPCRRCGTPIRRTVFMNRSSYFCPRCQPVPRRRSRPA